MTGKVERSGNELSDNFRELAERYAALSRAHTREQLLWRPGPGAWCIAECAEHVALGNTAYLEKMLPAIARTSGKAEDDQPLRMHGWLARLVFKSVLPEAPRKLKAPKKIRPILVDPERAFSRLAKTYAEIQIILRAEPQADLNKIRFQNPFLPLVRFTVASGILILAAHCRRHLMQAEQIAMLPEFQQMPSVTAST